MTSNDTNALNALCANLIHEMNRLSADFDPLVWELLQLLGKGDHYIAHLSRVLRTIQQLSLLPVHLWESDGKHQVLVTHTLYSLLCRTLTKDFHTETAPCKHLDRKTGHCLHGNSMIDGQQHRFTCEFHAEPLYVHLVLACLENAMWAIDRHYSQEMVMCCALIGLYHDIGKIHTLSTYEFKENAMTGFPAHAEIGHLLFIVCWHPDMRTILSKDRYMEIATAILLHMCGTHGAGSGTQYPRDLLRLETPEIRALLVANRVGDNFGRLPTSGSRELFSEENRLFEEQIMAPSPVFNLNDMLQRHTAVLGNLMLNKIAVFPIGRSGAGKTTLLARMKMAFPGKVAVVSRDEAIAWCAIGVRFRLVGLDYETMYRIYTTGKALSALMRRLAKQPKSNERASLLKAKNELMDAQTAWNAYWPTSPNAHLFHDITVYDADGVANPPNITEDVDRAFKAWIIQAINDPHVVIVAIDTCMNCFPQAIEHALPAELARVFRVHIHVNSYMKCTESSNGTSVAEQLAITGPTGLHIPIHPNGFDTPHKKKAFASLSADKNSPIMSGSNFRPHLVLAVARTPDGAEIGYTETFQRLERLIRSMDSNPPAPPNGEPHDAEEKRSLQKEATERIENVEYGVDVETMNMHADEYYAYLLRKFGGNRDQIRQHFQSMGFGHRTLIHNSYATMTPTAQRAFCVVLAKMSEDWRSTGYVTSQHTADEFETDQKLRERYINSAVILKYHDGMHGSRFWKNLWAREMRGLIMFVNPETLAIRCVSKLERGAEVVTGMVSRNAIETQDVKSGRIDILDQIQQETCRSLLNHRPIKMHLSSKGDGSLLILTSYTGRMIGVMMALINGFGSEFTRLMARQSLALTNGTRLIVPSTQGTVMEGGFMAPYMITSMLVGAGICSREDLKVLDTGKMSYMDAWNMYGVRWLGRFLQLPFFDNLTEIQTFAFEAICANRCGLFGDHTHTELAVSYPRDRLIFLGTMICDRWFYLPHSMFSRIPGAAIPGAAIPGAAIPGAAIPSTAIPGAAIPGAVIPFEEPLWWNIERGDQVDHMIEQMDRMILGELSKAEYLRMFPPKNPGFDIHSPEAIERAVIDFEGWVALTILDEPTDPHHHEVIGILGVPSVRYSKIKTLSYYIAHKYDPRNIANLFAIAQTAGDIFPLARKISRLLSTGELSNGLNRLCVLVNQLFDFSDPHNTLLDVLREEIAASEEKAASKGRAARKNPLAGIERRPTDVRCKILINLRLMNGETFSTRFLVSLYQEVFPEIDTTTPDLGMICASLVMFLRPWDPDLSSRITGLTPTSSELRGLVSACIGTSL